MRRIKPYELLAHYYDELFGPYRSPIDAARDRILQRILPDIQSACDLACGTGTTALILARKGIKTYAVDLSPKMCQVTRDKAKRARVAVRVIRADMRSFRLPSAVDLVTCEYDAVNHVPNRADLWKVATAVARALRPGGYFYFDVNTSRAFDRYWIGAVWIERPGVVLVMRNGHNRQATQAWSDIEWFIREGQLWRRRYERVQEVCWAANEIRRTLEKTGFKVLRSSDAAPFFKNNPPLGPGCRTFYLARKLKA
jgi:SAM-dependent methyltransferase